MPPRRASAVRRLATDAHVIRAGAEEKKQVNVMA